MKFIIRSQKNLKVSFSTTNDEIVNSVQPFYPNYLGNTIEFTPRRLSTSMTRPVENSSNLRLIPAEIEVNNELKIPSESDQV